MREIPALAEDYVLVKIRACGVCGDGCQLRSRLGTTSPCRWGHEISGEVVEVGKNVTTVKPGRTA